MDLLDPSRAMPSVYPLHVLGERLTKGPLNVKSVDVTALGMNEVPKGGGGFYWDNDSPDCRDQALGQDRAGEIKLSALAELIDIMRNKQWFGDKIKDMEAKELARVLDLDLKGTQFRAIGEFGRTIHAEMAAIIDAARRGVSVEGHSMYVTTFPCHNCAKHIIGAGLCRVIYLEPYPKSRVDYLHAEEVLLDPEGDRPDDADTSKVMFVPFTGIAPRQYGRLFSRSERRKRVMSEWYDGKKKLFPAHLERSSHLRYLASERDAVKDLENEEYQWDAGRAGVA